MEIQIILSQLSASAIVVPIFSFLFVILIIGLIIWKKWFFNKYFCYKCNKIYKRYKLRYIQRGLIEEQKTKGIGATTSGVGGGGINTKNQQKELICNNCYTELLG